MRNPANPRRPREVRCLARDLDFADALRVALPHAGRGGHECGGRLEFRVPECRDAGAARVLVQLPQLRHQRIEHVDVRVRGRRAPVIRLAVALEQRQIIGGIRPPLAGRFGLADEVFELLGREIRARHRRDTTADDGNHGQLHFIRIAVGRHRVVRPPNVDARDAARDHDARISFRQAQYAVDGVLERQAPSCAVLRMLICLKSAAGHPCDTGAICPGCPLPQLNAPPSTYVDGPPTASIEFQKSVVRD